MEDPNSDSQDSETSSEDSWILLSNDEAATDLAYVEVNKNCRVNSQEEVIKTLTDVDIKNTQSDIESDGISIISESELTQNSESDDDCNNTAVEPKSGKYEDERDISIKTDTFFNEMSNAGQNENLYKNDSMNLENKSATKNENSIFHTAENVVNEDLSEELHAAVKAENMKDTENLPSQIIDETKGETLKFEAPFYNCLNNAIQMYHLKKLITMPSFLCTSVVIFAVLIFPYFSSEVDDANTLDQPDMKQFDEHSLTAKNIAVVDPLVYCMEIHKNENLYHDYNVKRCMKKLLKQMRKFKKSDRVQFLSNGNEIKENKYKNNFIENYDAQHVKKKDFDRKGKKYKGQKKYNNLNTHENGEFKKLSENFQNFPLNLEEYDTDLSESYTEEYTFIDDLVENNENHITKYPNSQQRKEEIIDHNEKNFEKRFVTEKFNKLKKELNEMRNSLLKKEKLLKKCEKQLTKRELQIQKTVKTHNREQKNENNLNNDKFGVFRKQKGDFDKDVHQRKFEKQINSEFLFKEKQDKLESTNWQKSHEKFTEDDDDEENWRKGKNILKMKGVFHSKKQRNNYDKKEAASVPLWKNFNKESSKRVSTIFDHNKSRYLRMQNIMQKNRTKILDDDNITVTGEWYLNLVHGRHDIRKKEGKASWWFERVEFRKNKRNKAFWYFRYMLNREDSRYRERNI